MSNTTRRSESTSTDGAHPGTLEPALSNLVYNLRWSWSTRTMDLFRTLDPSTWEATQNPVAVLRAVEGDPSRIQAHAPAIRAAAADLAAYLGSPPSLPDAPRVAYFSAEFGAAECLPIYSGGLGILAGDHLKAASDLGLPLIGVGLLYRYGYFRQTIDATGYQREQYDRLDPTTAPLTAVLDRQGRPLTIDVPFPGRLVHACVWRADVGRVPLYLLDSDLAENREDDRWITGHLYGGDHDTRIRQELVLGIGGARLLRALAVSDSRQVFHMNEGHSAFLALELARERLRDGRAGTFAEAAAQVAPRLAFTTHTPVSAGHDAFPSDLVEAYFAGYRAELALSHEQFMQLGRRDVGNPSEPFSMTILALRSAARRNAVSQLHGIVSREMWGDVGVGVGDAVPAVPMDAITNGVHTTTWAGPEMSGFFDARLGTRWRTNPEHPASWRELTDSDPGELWQARTTQRERLLERVDAGSRAEGTGGLASGVTAANALVLAFARRFATYKRAALLLADPDRLARLLGGNPRHPVVLVFAGKAHPRDDPGKLLMQRIVQASRDERFRGRLVFLENYDIQLARLMVQGADVWLNTPRRPQEASGTSGMKAVLNGALHLSELDGWWDEAYQPGRGWALGAGIPDEVVGDERDVLEARQLANLLEREVAPLFFERDAEGRPLGWLALVRESIRHLAPRFSARRMVVEYVDRIYRPAAIAQDVVLASRAG